MTKPTASDRLIKAKAQLLQGLFNLNQIHSAVTKLDAEDEFTFNSKLVTFSSLFSHALAAVISSHIKKLAADDQRKPKKPPNFVGGPAPTAIPMICALVAKQSSDTLSPYSGFYTYVDPDPAVGHIEGFEPKEYSDVVIVNDVLNESVLASACLARSAGAAVTDVWVVLDLEDGTREKMICNGFSTTSFLTRTSILRWLNPKKHSPKHDDAACTKAVSAEVSSDGYKYFRLFDACEACKAEVRAHSDRQFKARQEAENKVFEDRYGYKAKEKMPKRGRPSA